MATKSTTEKSKTNGADLAVQMTERATEAVKENVDHVQAAAADVAKRASKEAETLVKSGSKFVKENPGMALAGAAGLGVLLGLALNRRS